MKQVQANRLVALMNVMETIPNKHFDIESWAGDQTYEEKELDKKAIIEFKCDTTACAVGWAVLMLPVWQKAFYFTGKGGLRTSLIHKETGEPYCNEFTAIAEFLGIKQTEADYMFGYIEYDNFNVINQPKVTRARLLSHCKKVLDTYGYVWE